MSSCQTAGNGGSGATKHGTLFLKVFNEEGNRLGPTDIKLKLDGAEILNRNFATDPSGFDGQYQIRLPQGKHRLEAAGMQGSTFTSRAFKLDEESFLQVYVTEGGKWRFTPSSKRSMSRLVIKHMREARGIQSNPALWMIITAPQPATPTRPKRSFANNGGTLVRKPADGTIKRGTR
ncbi:MAG: hypothetical protein SGI88_16905 [Candidatus Hydrogenedentes bacterium]|nr:hypothetical protein [Candidatus Hydrogenedentota bacterium]